MPHCHGNLRHVGECFLEVVCKALGGSTHGVDVHTVGACTHDAAQTACAEFKVFVEAFNEQCGVFCLKHLLHFGACGFIVLVT